jgi:hypothetical protein
MTNVFKNYLIPDQTPDAILIKKGDLGGFVVEMFFGNERKVAGFTGVNAVASVLPAMLLGKSVMDAVAQAQAKIVEAPAPVKKGRAKKLKVVETKVEEVAAVEQPKKRGWPKGKKRGPKLNGAATEIAAAA